MPAAHVVSVLLPPDFKASGDRGTPRASSTFVHMSSDGGILADEDVVSWLSETAALQPLFMRKVAFMVSLRKQGLVRNKSARETLVGVADGV